MTKTEDPRPRPQLDPLDDLIVGVARRTGRLLWRWTELFFELADVLRGELSRRFSSRRPAEPSRPEPPAAPPGSDGPTEPHRDPDRPA